MTSSPHLQKQLFDAEPDRPEWERVAESDQVVAEVALPLPIEQTYDYLVPEPLRSIIQPGQRVQIHFGAGNRKTTAFCVSVKQLEDRSNRQLKSLLGIVDREPIVDAHLLELTKWIADRYICGWGQALETAVPSGVKKQAGTREMMYFTLAENIDELLTNLKIPAKQAAIIDLLRQSERPLKGDEITEDVNCGPAPINGLREKGLIVATRKRVGTFETSIGPVKHEQDLVLNPDQKRALATIVMQIRMKKYRTLVLHGVTGSGKTEVYIQAIREVVGFGRQAIVLVPEISLTPQTIRRFQSRFDSVAVLHSHLTDAERHWHWQRIARGDVQVVVGARSAVFAPTPHLGIIVIDEEHETSFKQDITPRYHAREVARQRAKLSGVPLILGSATPTLETWMRVGKLIRPAQEAAPQTPPRASAVRSPAANTASTPDDPSDLLLSLPSRVSGLPLPPVSIVDIRNDPVCSKGHSIGRALRSTMQTALNEKGQIILFLNLRGYSPTVWCRSCGGGVKCPNCDITLTLHRDRNIVLCHTCNYESPPPELCPQCGMPGVRYFGAGTQRLEYEVKTKFPSYKSIRMDSDTMKKRGSHDEALESFRRGEAQILLGTQMIAKGLDFPNVTLVGVVDADTILHQPDLRALERTFQLIAQVAGRAGRSERGGRVIVQTCSPGDVAIQCAVKHDFVGFANGELANRLDADAPPFRHWARVILRGPIEQAAQAVSLEMSDSIREVIAKRGLDMRVLGPAPCPVAKMQSNYRFHFLLSAPTLDPIRALWRELRPNLPQDKSVEYVVDVDPLNLR